MTIEIKRVDNEVRVTSPYVPEFAPKARALGGRFVRGPNYWAFDPRDEERVRALCVEIYGTDGSPSKLVTIRLTFKESRGGGWPRDTQLFIAGRDIARVYDRDGGAKLGEGVVVLAGKIGSGGSRKNPALAIEAGTVIDIRDVPELAAQKLRAQTDKPFEVEIDETNGVVPTLDEPGRYDERQQGYFVHVETLDALDAALATQNADAIADVLAKLRSMPLFSSPGRGELSGSPDT